MDQACGPLPAWTQASFSQARMWFAEQFDGGASAYNVPIPIRLHGPLDVGALAASLTDVVGRHPALRTTFTVADGQPYQVVRPAQAVPLPVTDLSTVAAPVREAAVAEAIAAAETQPIDLHAGPILRAELLRLAEQEHVFVAVVHHIAVDGPSLAIFCRDLAAGYRARTGGAMTSQPEPDSTYVEFAAAQRSRLSGGALDTRIEYWRTELAGVPHLDLPVDRLPATVASSAGGFVTSILDRDLVERLRALANAEGGTLFAGLAAGMAVLLSRYSGQDDMILGTSRDERYDQGQGREWSGVIGPFGNTTLVRVNLAGRPSFRELVARVSQTLAAGLPHVEVPFDVLVNRLQPERGLGRTPFFRVFVGLDELAQEVPDFVDVDAQIITPDFAMAKFDLGFGLHTGHAEPVLDAGFSTDLFDRETVDRMLGHLRTIVENALACPDVPVTHLDLLTPTERLDLLTTWNATTQPFPDRACLHDFVEMAAAARPDSPAVICDGVSTSYAQLNDTAGRIARTLRHQGIGTGAVVGVCLRRSHSFAAAVLGVLKAGAAYLPLDPDYPAGRLSFMVRDSGSALVLTDHAHEGRVPPGVLTLLVDALDDHCAVEDWVRPSAYDLAYIIYTSGSTGSPKGIALRHRGAVNNFRDFVQRFTVGPADRVLGVSSTSFDMSVFDLLGVLGAGGTVVYPSPAETREPSAWARLLRDQGVTIWHSAPALLQLLLEHLEPGDTTTLAKLRLALLGGDWISLDLPDRLRAVAPAADFVALGGATEASMDSIIYPVGQVDPAWRSIPYGRPMANQQAYILDGNRQLVPVGVPGELYLGGVGLAAGYLNRPELTAERFIEHCFGSGPTQRLYRTGDLARYHRDGVIELLGRTDFQVKIHGLRVELGEIEAVLRRVPGVGEAAVVAQGERGHASLVAFIVPTGASRTSAEVLRAALGAALPAHMVPSGFAVLDRLPVTPNGKVDRAALVQLRVSHDADSVALRDELDRRIADAWQEVLGVDDIGIDDNFFELGGDSFAAVRAMLALDRTLPVVELFKNPTIRALAEQLRTALSTVDCTRLLQQLTPEDRPAELTLICFPYGGGNAIAFQPLAAALPERFALLAVTLPGHDPSSRDDALLTFEEAAARCTDEVLTTCDGPIVVYGHCAGSWLAVDVARRLEERGADLRGVIIGASLPHHDPEASLRELEATTDAQWLEFLRSIGGLDGSLDAASAEYMMRAGRVDHEQAMTFQRYAWARPPRRLDAPMLTVFGEADAALPDYDSLYPDWRHYAESVDAASIPGGGHYFVSSHAGVLADLIDRKHPAAALVNAGWRED